MRRRLFIRWATTLYYVLQNQGYQWSDSRVANALKHTVDSVSPVAVVEPLGGHAGMNYYDIELTRGLHLSRVESRLYTCDETLETSEPGVTVLKPFKAIYGEGSKVMRGWRFLRGLVWSAGDARRHAARVVHLHYFQYGAREVACCIVFKALRMKIVATVHDVTPFSRPEGLNLFRTILRLTDHAIVHNDFSARMLSRHIGRESRLPPTSVIKPGNYIGAVKALDKAEAKRMLDLPPDQPILLFFGQIKPEKGLKELLSAFALYKRGGGSGFLLVVGRPVTHAREDYPAMAEDLDISDHVRFELRYVADEEANACFCAADLVVLPYREIYQSAVLLMAMSYGRAVLCSDLEPMKEVVEEGVTGFIFPSGDVDALAETLSRALHDMDALDKISGNAQVEMERNYGWRNIGQRTVEAYQKALGSAASCQSAKAELS